MTIELANRLCAYRKHHSLSQEELAEKLEISRQAVSCWERAETSPDTDNLILHQISAICHLLHGKPLVYIRKRSCIILFCHLVWDRLPFGTWIAF